MAKLGEYGHLLEKLSEEDLWLLATFHLLDQGVQSKEEGSSRCLYSGPNELCCVAAPFIPNYDPSMEGKVWGALVFYKSVDPEHGDIIEKFQNIHDSNTDWATALKEYFPEKIIEIERYAAKTVEERAEIIKLVLSQYN